MQNHIANAVCKPRSDLVEVVKKLSNTNNYRSKNWDKEDATRYVLEIDNSVVEASFFVHYLNGVYVKSVIELPTSFGCPVKCAHCASSLIKKFRKLKPYELLEIVDLIVSDQKLERDVRLLVTYSGIGEGAYVRENVFEASDLIYEKYKNFYFTFTTVGIDYSFVEEFNSRSFLYPLHYLQVTYLHWDKDRLVDLVPTAKNYDFKRLCEAINKIQRVKVRINYVVILDYNDSISHAEKLSEYMDCVKDNVVFRISKLNETEAGDVSNLNPACDKTLEGIHKYLSGQGFSSYIFRSEVNDNLNCGQLAWKY